MGIFVADHSGRVERVLLTSTIKESSPNWSACGGSFLLDRGAELHGGRQGCRGVEFTLETDTNSSAETGPLSGMSAVEGGER
jgi:hypothetical protein